MGGLIVLVLWLIVPIPQTAAANQEPKPRPPNIIWIWADNLAYGDLALRQRAYQDASDRCPGTRRSPTHRILCGSYRLQPFASSIVSRSTTVPGGNRRCSKTGRPDGFTD